MVNPYLSSDESILLTTQDIVVDGRRYEAILTSLRLILLRSDDAKAPHREIFLSAVGSAFAGETADREPTITLTLTDPDGVLNTLQLVFARSFSGQKNSQYGDWVALLKERIRFTATEPPLELIRPVEPEPAPARLQAMPDTGEPPRSEPDRAGEEAVADTPPAPASPPEVTETPASGPGTATVAIIVIVVAAAAIAAIAGFPLLPAAPPQVPGTVTPLTTTPSVTVSPSPPPAATATATAGPAAPATPAPTLSAPAIAPPPAGVWILVDYPGSYTGSIGTSGRVRDIAGRGSRFFQLYALTGVITAEVRKQERNGEKMDLILYKEGTELRRANTTVPGGTVYLNIGI